MNSDRNEANEEWGWSDATAGSEGEPGHRGGPGRHGGHRRPGGPGGRGPGGPDWLTGFGGWGPEGGPWGGMGRGRPGPPPWVHDLIRQFGGPTFGPEQRPRGPRRPRARRGDVRAAILDVLAGDEMNGYQLIQEIAERTGGVWKPSPGSVYPTIQQLEDEGLVEGRDADGRRLLRLTGEGRRYVEEHPEEMGATWAPFEPEDDAAPDDRASHGFSGTPGGDGLMPVVGQVMGAMWQVVTTGTAQQRAEARDILSETRRRLYQLLADGDPE